MDGRKGASAREGAKVEQADMTGIRLRHASPHYLSLLDAAGVKIYADEAEVLIDLDGDDLTISLPVVDGSADAKAMEIARSALAQLGELDGQAATFLFSLQGWPYEEDAVLWLLIAERDNVRFCYQQRSVNDEHVVGFKRDEEAWTLIGLDPRFRSDNYLS